MYIFLFIIALLYSGGMPQEFLELFPQRETSIQFFISFLYVFSGKYVESAHLTPEDFIPTEYLVDEEGNLVFDATSTMKSPPGMYQSDEGEL
jgi:hypothetical protein